MIKWKGFEQFKFGASGFSFLRLSRDFSETCSAQSLATCTGLNEYFLSSSSQEAPKFALKFFRKYSYGLILREIQTVQQIFILSSKYKFLMK